MSKKQIVLTGKELVRLLEKMGFSVVRIKGPHHRLKHSDGRVTTVPAHGNEDLPKGLIKSIVCEDLGMTVKEFERLMK